MSFLSQLKQVATLFANILLSIGHLLLKGVRGCGCSCAGTVYTCYTVLYKYFIPCGIVKIRSQGIYSAMTDIWQIITESDAFLSTFCTADFQHVCPAREIYPQHARIQASGVRVCTQVPGSSEDACGAPGLRVLHELCCAREPQATCHLVPQQRQPQH